MKKEDLQPGHLVVTEVALRKEGWHEVPYMLGYHNDNYYHPLLRQTEYLKQTTKWCFQVVTNKVENQQVVVALFTPELKAAAQYAYLFRDRGFNIYNPNFRLRYADIELPVEPVCSDCHNYCQQSCFRDLRYLRFN